MSDDKMISGEISEPDNQITQHLQYLYNIKSDDAQSLVQIRERLLKNSKESLPAIDSLKNSTELPHERQKPPRPLYLAPPSERNRTLWSQRVLQLVAVLLVAALTGAFALVLTFRGASSGGNTPPFPLHSGWQQVAVYSGRGNTTLTGVNRSLPQLTAYVVTCTNNHAVDITMSGERAEYETNTCQSPPLTIIQPTSFSYNESPTVVIQTIKVTAPATTSWQIHLLQAIRQPTFHLGSDWKLEGPMASGSEITSTSIVGIGTSGGYANTSTRTWGILTVCFGSGKSYLQISPDIGNIPLPTCTGQPELTVLRFSTLTTIHNTIVYGSNDMIWNIRILACTDEAVCQHLPALHVTPKS